MSARHRTITLSVADVPEMEQVCEGRAFDDVVIWRGHEWVVAYMRHVINYLQTFHSEMRVSKPRGGNGVPQS